MRNKEFILPTANSSAPRTEEEKQAIIEKATKAYEAYLDALGFDWRNDPNSTDTPRRVAKAFVNDLEQVVMMNHLKLHNSLQMAMMVLYLNVIFQ